jgi:hypothetical protein
MYTSPAGIRTCTCNFPFLFTSEKIRKIGKLFFGLVGQPLDVHPELLKIPFVRLHGPRIFQRDDGAEIGRLAEGADALCVVLAGLWNLLFMK